MRPFTNNFQVVLFALTPNPVMGLHALELKRLATTRISSNPMALSVTPASEEGPAVIAVADLMKSLTVVELQQKDGKFSLKEAARHFATVWSSAMTSIGDHQWLLADTEGNLCTLRREVNGPTADDRKRLQVTGTYRLGEMVNKIAPIVTAPSASGSVKGKGKDRSRTISSAGAATTAAAAAGGKLPRAGPLVTPQAFVGTVEGSIYLHGSINATYLDVLLRLQGPLAQRVQAPGYIPWANYRAWKTVVKEEDEPFRFIDGEVVESALLHLDDTTLSKVLDEAGLSASADQGGFGVTVSEARSWGEELRRLY
jgi:DNA damage-binding protein 1